MKSKTEENNDAIARARVMFAQSFLAGNMQMAKSAAAMWWYLVKNAPKP